MRLLPTVAFAILLQTPALASEKLLTFSMLDIGVETHRGVAHLVAVSLDDEGKLRLQDQSLIPLANGGYYGVVRRNLEDGSITAVFHIQKREQDYTGDYSIVSGSGAYSGARGQGSLTTLTGRDAALSSTGVFRVQLQVTIPDHRIAVDE